MRGAEHVLEFWRLLNGNNLGLDDFHKTGNLPSTVLEHQNPVVPPTLSWKNADCLGYPIGSRWGSPTICSPSVPRVGGVLQREDETKQSPTIHSKKNKKQKTPTYGVRVKVNKVINILKINSSNCRNHSGQKCFRSPCQFGKHLFSFHFHCDLWSEE